MLVGDCNFAQLTAVHYCAKRWKLTL